MKENYVRLMSGNLDVRQSFYFRCIKMYCGPVAHSHVTKQNLDVNLEP